MKSFINNKIWLPHEPFRAAGRMALALLIALLPKCGLCLAAYLNLFSILGVSMTSIYPWILPVLSALLLLNLVIGFKKARQLNDYRAFGVSLAGMLVLVCSKIWLLPVVVSYVGVALLMVGSVFQLWQSSKVCTNGFRRQKTNQ